MFKGSVCTREHVATLLIHRTAEQTRLGPAVPFRPQFFFFFFTNDGSYNKNHSLHESTRDGVVFVSFCLVGTGERLYNVRNFEL